MIKKNFNAEELLPFVLLVILTVVFVILTKGQIFASKNLVVIVEQTVNVIIAGLGLLFVAAMAGTDITQGSLAALAAAFAAMFAVDYSPILAFPVAMLIGILSGLVLGFVNAKFKVPSFMASLAMLIALRAMVSSVLGSRSVSLPEFLKRLDNNIIKIPIVIILVLIIGYVFNYTRFGAYCKAIGENENAIRFTGINVSKIKIIAFVISGMMTGIASIFILARVGGSSNVLGVGFEMRILMAMFIGGIPVRGGAGTKLYKLLIGAFMITLLENGLSLSGVSGSLIQMIRGVVLLLVVYAMVTARDRMTIKHA